MFIANLKLFNRISPFSTTFAPTAINNLYIANFYCSSNEKQWFKEEKIEDSVEGAQEKYESKAYGKGLTFELRVKNLLEGKGFTELERIGKAGDRGVDILGKWKLGDKIYDTIIQCKNFKKKIEPKYLREFESTIDHDENKKKETIGIFFSPIGYSKACVLWSEESLKPLILCVLTENEILSQFLQNTKAKKLTNPWIQIGKKYLPSKDTNSKKNQEIQILYKK